MATITDMGIPGTSFAGILQPFHKHRWRIEFQFPRGSRSEHLTAMAITADRPKLEFEEIQLDRYNSKAWIFGKHAFQPISVTFEPDIGGQVHQAIVEQNERQQHLIADARNRFMGQAEAGMDYKFTTKLTMLNGDHSFPGARILEEWLVEGCGMQNNDFGDVDYQASETMKTVITLRYDHARLISSVGGDRYATGGPGSPSSGAFGSANPGGGPG